MASKIYTQVVQVGATSIYNVVVNPSGVLLATRGSLAIYNDTSGQGLGMFVNVDGASTWRQIADAEPTFILSPGNPNPGPNVFTSPLNFQAALAAAPGPKRAVFQNTFAPVVLTAGTYGDSFTTYSGYTLTDSTPITVQDGALLPGMKYVDNLRVLWTGTTPVGSPVEGGNVSIDFGCRIERDPGAGGPYWDTSLVATECALILANGARLSQNGGPVFDVGAGIQCQVIVFGLGRLEAETLSSAATALVIIGRVVPSADINSNQPSVAGTLFVTKFPAPLDTSGMGSPINLNDNTTEVTVSISAPTTIFLPTAGRVPYGHTITFARFDATGNACTIDGNGTNINGAASTTLNGQYTTLTMQLNNAAGVDEWILI